MATSIADNGAVGLRLRESPKFGMVGQVAKIQEIYSVDSVNWSWNEKAHPMTLDAMLKCVSELATAAQGLPTATKKSDESTALLLLQTAVRQISVPLRKLLLDNDGGLLRRTIGKPVFLPPGGKKGKFSKAIMTWRTQRHELTLGYEGGRREEVIVPESEHEIEIGRLYGIEFQENGWCQIGSPFDRTGSAIDMDAWLATKILQVNSVGYTVRDALKLVADFEGAHTNDGLPAFVAVGVKPDDFDKGASKRYRMANCVHFGCLSYIHLVVVFAGLYIIRTMQGLIQERPPSIDGVKVAPVAGVIGAVESDLSARSPIVNGCSEMIVVGKSNVAGAECRQTRYRIWSGCEEWDKPVASTQPCAGAGSGTQA